MKPDLSQEFYGTPWMLLESRLNEIGMSLPELARSVLHSAGNTPAADGGCGDGESDPCMGSPPYQVVSGVAVIPIYNCLAKRDSWLLWLFGGTSYDSIAAAIRHAVADSNIKGVVLDIDSPGGSTNGCAELAEEIFSLRGKKPIKAVAGGTMASAALFLGTAADEVIVARSATVGSLGVLLARRDWSGAEEQMGIRTHYIKSGAAKADGSPSLPFAKEEQQRLQTYVNSLFEIFLESVARYRGLDVETLRQAAGDARVFVGQEAIGPGLADRVGTLRETIAELARDPDPQLPICTGVEHDDPTDQPESRSPYARRIERRRPG